MMLEEVHLWLGQVRRGKRKAATSTRDCIRGNSLFYGVSTGNSGSSCPWESCRTPHFNWARVQHQQALAKKFAIMVAPCQILAR